MLPSARRAELSRQYFDNSYLSRRAFEVDPNAPGGCVAASSGAVAEQHHYPQQQQRNGRQAFGKNGSVLSHTTAGLTTFDEDLDTDDFRGENRTKVASRQHMSRGVGGAVNLGSLPFGEFAKDHIPVDDSEFSDDDSLGSVMSGDSQPSTTYGGGIRYSNSAAGQIWNILDRLDDVVLEVKVCCVRSLVLLLRTRYTVLFLVCQVHLRSGSLAATTDVRAWSLGFNLSLARYLFLKYKRFRPGTAVCELGSTYHTP